MTEKEMDFYCKDLIPKAHTCFATLITGLAFFSVAVVSDTVTESPIASSESPYTLKIVNHGEGANRSDNLSAPARQSNRRADVSIKTEVLGGYEEIETEGPGAEESVETAAADAEAIQSGKTFNNSVRLNDGGVIWVSEDPAKVIPKLNVSGSSTVEIEKGVFLTPMSFTISTNYSHFIDSWELDVYEASDEQLSKPLARFRGVDLSANKVVEWNGETSSSAPLQSGEELVYILTARSNDGHFDETDARQLSIVGPGINLETLVSTDSNALESNLKRQTIPVYGSTITISGRDVAEGNVVAIDDVVMSLNDRQFVTEIILPEGEYSFDVSITDGAHQYSKKLDVELKEKYLFMVGLADLTVREGKVSGRLESLADGDEDLDGDIFVDGRLAFYLKGKIKGKYLITAQMDTETAPVDELFDNAHKKDPESIFRRLDPDQYYPVYGDDSTLSDDTDSQGKLYVRVDWDKSQALWGNYNTDLTGTELSSFNRSLYGAKLNHKNTQVTTDGEHKTDVTVFVSEAQSAYAHNQFLGTGGSLYYLKDKDIVDGSEKIWIEVRERGDSERAVEKIALLEGQDYQIDDFQGRIILNRPLLQIAVQSNSSLIKDNLLDANQVFLMVDYEYVPSDFESDKSSFGGRAKAWLNDHFAIGGTFVQETREVNDYEHRGIDVTFQKDKGTYLKGEYAQSKSSQNLGSFLSTDGGLNFTAFSNNVGSVGADTEGSASSLEARLNLNEYSDKEGSIGVWYKQYEAGFSRVALDNTVDTVDAGISALLTLTDNLEASLRASVLDKKDTSKDTSISLQGDYKVNEGLLVSGELKYVKEQDPANSNNDGEAMLGAAKVGYDLSQDVNVYAVAQSALNRSGNYDSNNLFTLGSIAKVNDKLDLNAEFSSGDRGEAVVAGTKYALFSDYNLYANYTLSTDGSDKQRNILTLGQRKTVSGQLKVYTEHQYTHEETQAGLGHVFGLDYTFKEGLTADASYQTASLEKDTGGIVDRDAVSVGLRYAKDQTEASTRLEYRKDRGGSEKTGQWVSVNRVKHRISPSLRLQGKLNYSETNDQLGQALDAKFAEVGFGFAYRPINHDRHNILGRITYLYDLAPIGQSSNPDERSLIASLENSYQVNQRWEVGGKLAQKQGEIRSDRGSGNWGKNDASLVATRVRYHLTHKWDATTQYHWMNSQESRDTQHGALVSASRHVGKHLKFGLGYNFTNFDDSLRNTDGTSKGWFVNLVGKL